MPFRLDTRGTVRKVEPTLQGGVRVSAAVRKVGVLSYTMPDGSTRRELVPAQEIARADGLRGAPVTNRHPPGAVTRKNYKQFAVGHVDSDGAPDGDHLVCDLVIQADDALTAVEAGVREVSAGYTCDLDPTPGVWQGISYDAVQRNVKYNHIALVPAGRAGKTVALRMDAAGDVEIVEENMDLVVKLQTELATEKARADKAEADLKAEKARADKAEGENAVNKARADKAEGDLKTRADAEELARVCAVAAKLVKGFKAEGKSAAQVKAEVVKVKFPGLKLDEKDSAERLDGMFEAAASGPGDDGLSLRRAVKQPEIKTDEKPARTAEQARQDMMERNRGAYKSAK